MYSCDQLNCNKKFKNICILKHHKAFVHDIDVIWHHCDQLNCNSKFKTKGHLKRHKMNVHNINVTWHHCDQANCNYKCKDKSSIFIRIIYIIPIKFHKIYYSYIITSFFLYFVK